MSLEWLKLGCQILYTGYTKSQNTEDKSPLKWAWS